MPNYKLLIEYKGTEYTGWQKQKNTITVQGEIEKALKKIFSRPINLIGAGRTDAGVHALGQVANFSVETKLSKDKILKALNFYLPKDIRIQKISYVPFCFHSRFSTRSKVYRYVIIQKYSPFLKEEAYFYPWRLDFKNMKEAAKSLLGRHNFSSFQNRGSSQKETEIILYKLKIKKAYLNLAKQPAIIIEFEASAFLYRMVRNLVGLLLEVGRGKISPKSVKSILKACDRQKSPPSVPAHGLYLYQVKY